MGAVLRFKASTGKNVRKAASVHDRVVCQIVIFPGVRIERHDTGFDLGHRLLNSASIDMFDGIGGGSRPRKSS